LSGSAAVATIAAVDNGTPDRGVAKLWFFWQYRVTFAALLSVAVQELHLEERGNSNDWIHNP
jgi:hypothetical protein